MMIVKKKNPQEEGLIDLQQPGHPFPQFPSPAEISTIQKQLTTSTSSVIASGIWPSSAEQL